MLQPSVIYKTNTGVELDISFDFSEYKNISVKYFTLQELIEISPPIYLMIIIDNKGKVIKQAINIKQLNKIDENVKIYDKNDKYTVKLLLSTNINNEINRTKQIFY